MGRTVVIGAGVIGLACAYELRKRGADVLVLDRGPVGAGASAGNAGWVVPGISGPVPSPGLVGQSIRWMARRDSPLYIKPRVDPAFSRWLWHFWRNCRPGPYHAAIDAVAELNRRTMPLLDEWRAAGVRFEMHAAGLLFAGLSRAAVERAVEEVYLFERFGYQRPALLDTDGVRELEPGLSPQVAGGFLVAEERHVRPESLTAGLAATLEERGVEVRSGVEVTQTEQRGTAVSYIVTNQGREPADQVVLAAGAWSGELARRFGSRLPIEAGKGYSITVDQPEQTIGRPLDLIEARVAGTPFDGALRLAGTMELSGLNLRIEPARVEAIRRAAMRYLGWKPRGARELVWVGMRPLTPDGLPIIGRMPGVDNLYAATGHAMLGVTLAPSTAEALADQITTGSASVDLAPFDPRRFVSRSAAAAR
jgi:D-amino-acid dehydrogenase